MKKYKQTIIKLSKILAVILGAVIILLCIQHSKDISLADIFNFTPKNLYLAVLFFLGVYVLKSFLFFVPVSILYFAAGVVFPPFVGVAVNTVGSFINATLPYLFGRYAGSKLTDKIIGKYPKMQKLKPAEKAGEWFFSYITRVVCVFPADISSIFLGSLKIKYLTYISGSMVGFLPGILACTLIGTNITDPTSPVFVGAIIAFVAIIAISLLIYKKTLEKSA